MFDKPIAKSELELKKYTVLVESFQYKGGTISIQFLKHDVMSTTKMAFITQKEFIERFERVLKNTLNSFCEKDQFKNSIVKFKIRHGMCTASASLNLYTKVVTKIPLCDDLENFGSIKLTLDELTEIYEVLKNDKVL